MLALGVTAPMSHTLPKRILSVLNKLDDSSRITPFTDRNWRSNIPKRPGVYVIRRARVRKGPVYVGETSNLFERMRDLGSWRNHTFTRQIKNQNGFRKPTRIRDHISKNYRVSFTVVSFGRKEVEESLVDYWHTDGDVNFNKPTPRRWRSDA